VARVVGWRAVADMLVSLPAGCDSRPVAGVGNACSVVCRQRTGEQPFAVKPQIDHLFDERVFAIGTRARYLLPTRRHWRPDG
jgi:hypothetical protein